MTSNELLTWGERWHYPYLRLGSKDAVRHGRSHWEALVSGKDAVRRVLAEQRIRLWDARLEEK